MPPGGMGIFPSIWSFPWKPTLLNSYFYATWWIYVLYIRTHTIIRHLNVSNNKSGWNWLKMITISVSSKLHLFQKLYVAIFIIISRLGFFFKLRLKKKTESTYTCLILHESSGNAETGFKSFVHLDEGSNPIFYSELLLILSKRIILIYEHAHIDGFFPPNWIEVELNFRLTNNIFSLSVVIFKYIFTGIPNTTYNKLII